MVFRILSVALIFAAQPVIAADKSVPQQSTANSKDDPNKIICRKYPVTGSLTQTTKVCHTRADWRRLADESRRKTEDIQDMRGGVNNRG